jgi:hypothetical protein
MRTIDELFALWGDAPTLGAAIEQKPGTVQKWRTRKRIPNDHWPALIAAAKKKGVLLTADDLLLMHSAPLGAPQGSSHASAVGG